MPTIDALGEAGLCRTTRPEELVLISPVQPDANQPLLHHYLDTARVGVNPGDPVPILVNPATGKQETPPRIFPHRFANAQDPNQERETVFRLGQHRQHIWVARRQGIVNRWRTFLAAPYNFDLEWLAESIAMGQGIGGSEFLEEYRGTAGQAKSNPTHGGQTPTPLVLPVPAATVDFDKHSFVLHQRITDTMVESSVVPAEFTSASEPSVNPLLNLHVFNETHMALYWRHKQVERVEPFWRGNPFLQKITKFWYQPREWLNTDFSLPYETVPQFPSRAFFTANSTHVLQDGLGFDQGYVGDIFLHSGPTNVEVLVPGSVFDIPQFQFWQFRLNNTVYQPPAGGTPLVGGPVIASGYIATIHHRSSDGLAFAFACRMVPPSIDMRDGITVLALQNSVSGARVDGVPVPNHGHAGGPNHSFSAEHNTTRPAGWVGCHYFLYMGPLSECWATLRAHVHDLDQRPDPMTIPSVVRHGTDLADVLAHVPLQGPGPRYRQPAIFPSGVAFP